MLNGGDTCHICRTSVRSMVILNSTLHKEGPLISAHSIKRSEKKYEKF